MSIRLSDSLRKVLRAGPVLWGDCARAIVELARARLVLAGLDPRTLASPDHGPVRLDAAQARLVERVRHVIPRVGRRLPWRADCLVQALAARRWLAGHAVPSRIRLGSRKGAADRFEAHAWLTVGDRVVTGWDIEGFPDFAEFPLS